MKCQHFNFNLLLITKRKVLKVLPVPAYLLGVQQLHICLCYQQNSLTTKLLIAEHIFPMPAYILFHFKWQTSTRNGKRIACFNFTASCQNTGCWSPKRSNKTCQLYCLTPPAQANLAFQIKDSAPAVCCARSVVNGRTSTVWQPNTSSTHWPWPGFSSNICWL